jgi:DNA helicase II / ATP-dependent DNA helicase PcrA
MSSRQETQMTEQSIASELFLDREFTTAVMACLSDPDDQSPQPPLTVEQQRVVFSPPDTTAVVIAGAGSGKTTVMAARLVALAALGVPVETLLGLTFTRKAAAELSHRVDLTLRRAQARGLVANDGNDPEISTYHSFAQRLVRDSGVFAGIDPGLRIETEFALLPLAIEVTSRSRHLLGDHQLDLRKAVTQMQQLDADCAEHARELGEVRDLETRRLAHMASHSKSTKGVGEFIATCQNRIRLSHVVEEYREAKRAAGVMDFGDMMRLAYAAAAHPHVRAHAREQFHTVLLDEYQDTSVVQRLLLQRLFDDNHPVVAVGDPKQSIYGFRGAAVANIERFGDHFPHNGQPAPTFTLSANFRSAEPIVNLANRSRAVQTASERTQDDARLTVGRDDLTGVVRIANFRSRAEETQAVVAAIRDEIADGVAAGDVLVLVRTNTEADAYTSALQRAGVPAVSSDSLAVFDSPEIRDLLAVLATVSDPVANADVVRLLTGPRWRIGLRDLAVIGRRAQGVRVQSDNSLADAIAQMSQDHEPSAEASLIDTIMATIVGEDAAGEAVAELSPAARERLIAFAQEFRELVEHTGEPLSDQLARIMRITGADTEILLGEQATSRVAAVNALFTAAAAYEQAYPDGGVVGFLRAVELARTYDVDPQFEPPQVSDAVRVLTVHKAKGLQAEAVFIPGFNENAYDKVILKNHWTRASGRIPDDLRGDRGVTDAATSEVISVAGDVLVPLTDKGVDHLRDREKALMSHENSRLVYVAFTRACQRLMVSSHTWTPDSVHAKPPSGHISELRGLPYVSELVWYEPDDGETNPLNADAEVAEYPVVNRGAVVLRQQAALRVHSAMAQEFTVGEHIVTPDAGDFNECEAEQVQRWDADIAALRREQRHAAMAAPTVALPTSLSVTGFQHLLADPQSYARNRRRPMPRRPSRAADVGTRFHDWVATRWGYQPPLVADIEYAADAQLDADDDGLQKLIDSFEASEFAHRQPFGVELPFTVTVAGQPITGRIDAVFDDGPAASVHDASEGPATGDPGTTEFDMASRRWLIVDWKTGAHSEADVLQLAVYRLAWAAVHGVPLSNIDTAFFYIARGELVYQRDLVDEEHLRDQLARLTEAL